MALEDNDKQEVAQLVRSEVGRVLAEASKAGGAGGRVDIRSVGTAIDPQTLVNLGRPIACDACCNGCD